MDILGYWPYVALAGLMLAILASVSVLLVIYHKSVVALLKGVFFSQVGFFYVVLFTFMVVSVTESGDFFNKAITHAVFGGVLGYAVATVFDLFSLVCMIARMNASRIADKRGMALALIGVVVCAGVSAFANVASAVQDYQVNQFSQIPGWMQQTSPYIGLVFPGMIVIVTLIADHIGDLNPQQTDSVASYRAKEQKKVDLLRVRLEIEKDRAEVQKAMAMVRGKQTKREQKTIAKLLEEANQNHQQAMTEMQTNFVNQIADLQERIEYLTGLLTTNVDAPVEQSDQEEKEEQEVNDGPNTEEIPQVNKPAKKSNITRFTKGGTSAISRRVQRIVKSNPDIKPTEIAKRLQISKGYASQLRTKVLDEIKPEMAASM